MEFISGIFTHEDAKVHVYGTSRGYCYKWIEGEPTEETVKTVPVMIIDFSYSMHNSGSVRPALDSVKHVCSSLIKAGCNKIGLIFFGSTEYSFFVKTDSDMQMIDRVMAYYFTNPRDYAFNGYFDPSGTLPEKAFKKLVGMMEDETYSVIFMTDGEFTGKQNYDDEWQSVAKRMTKDSIISCIGYANDKLENIKSMKNAFDKENIMMTYTTIANPGEIMEAMNGCLSEFEYINNKKITLGKYQLEKDVKFYTEDKLFNELVEYDILKQSVDKGVDLEWVKSVYLFDIDIGIRECFVRDLITTGKASKNDYNAVFTEQLQYNTKLQKNFMQLRSHYKEIKSRNLEIWNDLTDHISDLMKLTKDLQLLIADDLSQKKKYEISTKIKLTNKHNLNLQRRKLWNRNNKKDSYLIKVKSENPLTLVEEISGREYNVQSQKQNLDEYYVCFYTQDSWSEMLNTLAAIPIQYNWRENDDWAPSRSSVETISLGNFVSLEGYSEMQEIFGGNEAEHTKIYGNNKYIKSGHDGVNSSIPIVTDPYFMDKISQIKEKLAHMITGSNMTFSNRHFLFYAAVIRKCFSEYEKNQSRKVKDILLLLLATFKKITDNFNCIFDKTQKPVNRANILYNIAIGNTAPYLFNSAWESICYVLTSDSSNLAEAMTIYNTNKSAMIDMKEFKVLIWRMLYRHMLVYSVQQEKWTDPETWGLDSPAEIETKLKDGNDLNTLMMTENKFANIPEAIKQDVQKVRDANTIFEAVYKFSTGLSDDVFKRFYETYLPDEIKELNSPDSDLEFDANDTIFWTYWEVITMGNKECFPARPKEDIINMAVTVINSNYGDKLNKTLQDLKELVEFNRVAYETRYLPLSFTDAQVTKLNQIFSDVYKKKAIGESQFKQEVTETLDPIAKDIFTENKEKDNLDVLANLYNYCLNNDNTLVIKPASRLPLSCPADATSPFFLQRLSDKEFKMYYRTIGLGWANKRYRNWIDNLHPFMATNLHLEESEYVIQVIENAKNYKNKVDTEYLKSYALKFYQKFKN